MGRGLGKLQRKILEVLANEKGEEWYDIGSLAFQVFDSIHGVDCFRVSGYNPEKPTEVQMQSFWRAIRSLEERGLLRSKKIPRGFWCRPGFFGPKRGGVSFAKEVKLIV